MKKVIISIVILAGVSGVIALVAKSNYGQTNASITSSSGINSITKTSTSTSSGTAYKDGTYTGQTANVGYGPVQVKAVISGGKLTDIEFMQMPYDRMHSQQLSNESGPILKSQAITAQSAQVDGVSGATSTSEGFIKSLSSALNQAS